MPNFEEVVADIDAYFRQQWTTTPIVSQNQSYEPLPNIHFVYFEILSNIAFFASFGDPGSNRHRNVGQIIAHVFAPINTGDGKALTYARQIGSIFKGKNILGAHFGAASVGAGETADVKGNFWRRTVSIDFHFDEIA